MKIVDRETFLSLPPNTVFAKYEPCNFSDLCIKMESLRDDFWYVSFEAPLECNSPGEFEDACERAERGESVATDFDSQVRDADFNERQLFAIFEPADVAALIRRLLVCLPR